MILVSALTTILLLSPYWHISLKRSSRIYCWPVLKPWNTFYPFPTYLILSFCSISVPNLGFPSLYLWALNTEHLWKFSLGPGLFLLLQMFCRLPGQCLHNLHPKSVTSTLFSHPRGPVFFNSCQTFPLDCSVFSLQINTCQRELILLLPSKLAQHAQFLSFINNTNISLLGQAWRLHQHRCSLSFIAHGNQSLWLLEIILWKDSSSYAFFPHFHTNLWFISADAITKLIEECCIFLFLSFLMDL